MSLGDKLLLFILSLLFSSTALMPLIVILWSLYRSRMRQALAIAALQKYCSEKGWQLQTYHWTSKKQVICLAQQGTDTIILVGNITGDPESPEPEIEFIPYDRESIILGEKNV